IDKTADGFFVADVGGDGGNLAAFLADHGGGLVHRFFHAVYRDDLRALMGKEKGAGPAYAAASARHDCALPRQTSHDFLPDWLFDQPTLGGGTCREQTKELRSPCLR